MGRDRVPGTTLSSNANIALLYHLFFELTTVSSSGVRMQRSSEDRENKQEERNDEPCPTVGQLVG